MNGLLLYREYLKNVSSCIINYQFPEIETKELSDILDIAKDIEDLSYLDKVLSYAGSNGLFDKDREFIKKSVRLESKLKNFLDADYIENIISLDSLYDIEDSIIECVGDLADITNEINYKNLSISELSLGDSEEDIGANKLKTYQAEISKIFGILDDCKKNGIDRLVQLSKVEPKVEVVAEEKIVVDNEEKSEVGLFLEIEENTEIEGIDPDEIDDLDEWIANQDKEIIEKYKEREVEEDYLDNDDYDEDLDIFREEEEQIVPTNIVKQENSMPEVMAFENNKGVKSIDVFDEDDEEETETSTLSEKKVEQKEEKIYKKKEKLVKHESVTDVDDVLAKMILALNDNITKFPKATLNIADKVKEESKKIYSNMKVEEDEEE